MECPHCNQDIQAMACPDCGPAAPGDKFCQKCGQELTPVTVDPQHLLTCTSCGHKALPVGSYCPGCGHELPAPEAPADGQRVCCPDGMCIGILGPDGKCTECGKAPHEHTDG